MTKVKIPKGWKLMAVNQYPDEGKGDHWIAISGTHEITSCDGSLSVERLLENSMDIYGYIRRIARKAK